MKKTLGPLLAINPLEEIRFFIQADKISPDYKSGTWEDNVVSESIVYTRLDTEEKFKVSNGYESFEVSADAFSIIVNLFYWSDLTFRSSGEIQRLASNRFHALRAYVFGDDTLHSEHQAIYAITD